MIPRLSPELCSCVLNSPRRSSSTWKPKDLEITARATFCCAQSLGELRLCMGGVGAQRRACSASFNAITMAYAWPKVANASRTATSPSLPSKFNSEVRVVVHPVLVGKLIHASAKPEQNPHEAIVASVYKRGGSSFLEQCLNFRLLHKNDYRSRKKTRLLERLDEKIQKLNAFSEHPKSQTMIFFLQVDCRILRTKVETMSQLPYLLGTSLLTKSTMIACSKPSRG